MSNVEPTVLPAETRTGTIYNRIFWLSYLANFALVTANALTFRFAELVAYVGGTEQVAGYIVSTGVFGALLARLVLGQAIDRYGTRTIWTNASLVFVFGCLIFLSIGQISWLIYFARIAFAVSLACLFTCSMVHIQNQVPAHRRTEVIGTLGSSGFFGMMAGSLLSDWIFNGVPAGRMQFFVLFGTAAALAVCYFVIVVLLTRGDNHQPPHETPAAHRLLIRYWPGNVLLVAMIIGTGLSVTTVFLTRFATERSMLNGVGTFFTVYSLSALVFRISSRRWSRVIGRHAMILMGLAGAGIGHATLPFVTSEWQFLVPAIACGFGHAMLFPAVVSLGAGAFPSEYRGTGTTLVLGFTEVGAMISAPILGGIIDRVGFPAMFRASAAAAAVVAVIYALTTARQPDDDVVTRDYPDDQTSDDAEAIPFVPPHELLDSQPSPAGAGEQPVASPVPCMNRTPCSKAE